MIHSIATPLPVAVSIFLLTLSADAVAQSPPQRVNVLFISCDDLNTELGCYGSDFIKSPQIDRLAERGVRFDRAYCQNPLCAPSRASFLSGRRPESSLDDANWMPHFFREHGYATLMVGKVAHGWGITERAIQWDLKERSPKPAARPEDKNNPDAQFDGGRVVRRAVELMEQKRDRPFFLAVGLQEPHSGFRVPRKYYEMYPAEKVVLPQEPPEHLERIPAQARAYDQTRPAHDDWTDEQKKQRIADFQARYAYSDAQIGVLLDALDRLDLWDSTVVLLVGDHGMHFGEHGFWGKRSLFEESCRIPLIVAAPGIAGGKGCPRLVEHIDVYPTFAELCGLPVPAGVEATSFAPLLEKPQRSWKKAAFTQTERPMAAVMADSPSAEVRERFDASIQFTGRRVRTERYAYVEWGDEKTAELYDHQTDPHEYVNLADSPAHAEIRAELRRLLKTGWKGALPD